MNSITDDILEHKMQVQENVSLANYSSMRLGGDAKYLVEISSERELVEALSVAKENNIKKLVIGEGCNTIFGDYGFSGLIVVNKISGIEQTEGTDSAILEIGAGESWDDIVQLSVEMGYFDIAALSKIPGTVGAGPIQNIGAYGQQISDCLVSLKAYDLKSEEFVELMNVDCDFDYRTSRFNIAEKNRYIITSVKLRLSHTNITPPFYADIVKWFTKNNIDTAELKPEQLRQAVIEIRQHKLPDPSVVANCGSFFKNPIISNIEFNKIVTLQPEILDIPSGWTQPPYWDVGDNMKKIAAGWLIESVGFKDFHDTKTGMATWKNQALVLVNENAHTTNDLLRFKSMIVDAVQSKFEITLKQEPELVE